MSATRKHSKKHSKMSPSKELDVSEDIINAAAIGGNAMASIEPFGSAIGAAMGAVEEGMAILKEKNPVKGNPTAKRK